MVQNFSLAINELAQDEKFKKKDGTDYSSLLKEFNAGEVNGKKYRKQFSTIKDYVSHTEGRKEQSTTKHRIVESSLTDLN